jgi:hypothetical protein
MKRSTVPRGRPVPLVLPARRLKGVFLRRERSRGAPACSKAPPGNPPVLAARGPAFHIWLALLTCLAFVPQVRAELDPREVSAAIDRAIGYLKRVQRPDGTWPDFAANEGGVTSLCTLALLNAGVKPEDEAIQRALDSLINLPPKWTYAASLQTMVFCAAAPQRLAPQILKNVRWLEATQIKQGANRGAWSYPRAGGDNSNTQFAMLALYEAARVGVPVEQKTWEAALRYWRQTQNPNGSWGYQPGQPGTGSMTCAGIAAIVMCENQLGDGDATIENGRIVCCGQQRDQAVERALAWLGQNFSVHVNPGRGDAWLFYYLYGVERVGRMTARRFIGDHDWYREGTEMFVRAQDKLSGFWRGTGHGESEEEIGTSFALLFLAKGRRPILMGKLRHTQDDWNHHREDAANLTAYVEKAWQRDLSWQVIDLSVASVDDLLQSPVLFLNGSEAPQFSEAEVKALRAYIDQGGFLLAVASCGGQNFDSGFRLLMKRVFPEPEYELKLLPPDHPVWHAEQKVAANQVHPLYGISVGCRTSVIYSPDDLSCLWELARPGREARLDAAARQQVLGGLAIGINVLAYATNREVKYKYEIPAQVNGRQQEDRVERAKLSIAKLRHTGGWDSAPRALINAQEALARETGLRVSTDRRDLSITDDALFEYPVVFMHGRNAFHLSPAEREHLRMFVQRGGVVLADSICASEQFTNSFREEMQAIFGGQKLEAIPPDHPIITSRYGGFDLARVRRRDPQRGAAGGRLEAQVREVAPSLEGIKIGDRYGVLFSPYDLSCALERHESLDCQGYVREDAAKIAINLILYAIHE